MSDERMNDNQAENLLRAMSGDVSGSDASRPDIVSEVRLDRAHNHVTAHSRARGESPSRDGLSREAFDDTSPRAKVTDDVADYDFRQKAPICRDQIRGLHQMHDQVAKRYQESFSEMMRGDVEFQLRSVDQKAHHEFVYALESPSCFCVADVMPLDGQWIASVDQSLTFAMIDRMLGGEPSPNEKVSRPMTDIEVRLMHRVIEPLLAETTDAWSRLVALKPQIDSIDSLPKPVPGVGSNDVVVCVSFDVTVCSVRGTVRLCLPMDTIQEFGPRLEENHWCDGGVEPTDATRQAIASQLGHAPIEVVVNLASSKICTSDLLNLSVGDVIATEKASEAPLELSIQNVPKFTARAGAYQGKKAVRIETPID